MTYLALDQGTSSSRAILFDKTGSILGIAQEEFPSFYPQDGWVEQDPEQIWQTTLNAGRGVLAQTGTDAGSVRAIGITNQRETTLLWDRATSACLYPAIVWQDRRTAALCEELAEAGQGATVAARTGLLLDPYFSGTKMAWLLDNVPGARDRARKGDLCLGTVDSYLIWRLTAGTRHVTDATNASRTALFNIHTQEWDAQLGELFQVPNTLLPEVLDSAAEFGIADPQWFGAPIPICGVAGDQHAALIGQACISAGMSKCTYGTGCFAMTNTGAVPVTSNNRLLTTIAYRLNGKPTYALEGSVFSAGVAVKWLRDGLGLIQSAAQTEAMAVASAGNTQGVYLVPAFTGLGAPYWDPDARGVLSGLTLATTANEVVTATLASVVYQTQDLLAAMAADGADLARLRVDGGMVVNDWLCQFLADILNRPVQRPVVTETTALGAAMLAMVGCGDVPDLPAVSDRWQSEREFVPTMEAAERESHLSGWSRAVRRAQLQ